MYVYLLYTGNIYVHIYISIISMNKKNAVLGRIVSGYVADKFEARWLVFWALIASSAGLALVP